MDRKVNISDIHKLITEDDSLVLSDDIKEAIIADDRYESINAIWDSSLSFAPDVSFSPEAGFDSFKKKYDIASQIDNSAIVKTIGSNQDRASTKVFFLRKFAAAASIVLIAACCGILWFHESDTKYQSNGNVQSLAMADASSIVLDKNSTLEEKSGFGDDHRIVELNGKANFDIEKNENLPFKIIMGNSSIEVIGTQFDLSNTNGIIDLALIEGKVRFVSDQGESYDIVAGERMTYVRSTQVLNVDKIDDYSVFSWSNNGLRYTNASVSHVLTSLSQYFDYELQWSGNNADACTHITMTNIVDPKIDEIIEIIESIVDIDLELNHSSKTIEVLNINC